MSENSLDKIDKSNDLDDLKSEADKNVSLEGSEGKSDTKSMLKLSIGHIELRGNFSFRYGWDASLC